MSKLSDSDSRVILRNLGIFFPVFYALYYLLGVIFALIFSAAYDQYFPFDFKEFGLSGARPVAGLLTMIFTYLTSIVTYFVVIRSTHKAWDYAATLSIWHTIFSIAVMRTFPLNWIWWVALVVCTPIFALGSELVNYRFRDLREIMLER